MLVMDIDINYDTHKWTLFRYSDSLSIDMQRLMCASFQICWSNVLNVAGVNRNLAFIMYCLRLLFNE